LNRVGRRIDDVPETADDLDGISLGEDKGLPPGRIDVRVDDLSLSGSALYIADEQLGLYKGNFRCRSDGRFGCLPNDNLKRLIPPEEDLLGVAVGARIGEQPVEPEKHPQPSLVPGRAHLGRDSRQIHRAVDVLVRAEEDPLA